MSTEKHSIQEVADIVDREGLGYAVMDYMGAESIEDEQLAKLWQTASDALKAIGEILEAATATDAEGPEDGIR